MRNCSFVYIRRPCRYAKIHVQKHTKMSFCPEKLDDLTSLWEKPKRVSKRKKTEESPNTSYESGNIYDALDNDMDIENDSEDQSEGHEKNASRNAKIPPIVVHSFVNNHMETLNNIKKELKEDFDIVVRRNRIIIKTKNEDDYNSMIKKVSESKVEFHTYTLQSDKILRLALKGMAANVSANDIKTDLTDRGLKVIKVKQFEKNVIVDGQNSTVKLPLFIIDFEAGTKPKDVFKINRVCYCVVHWEKFQNGNHVVQCYNCQCFGHISKNCHKKIKCVLCAENHSLKDCPFKSLENQKLKCANCGEGHSAGSRECRTYKRILENKDKKGFHNVEEKKRRRNSFTNTHASYNIDATHKSGRLYSQAAAGGKQKQGERQHEDSHEKMSSGDFFAEIRDFLSNLNFSNIWNILKKMFFKIKRANDGFEKIMCVIEAITEIF